jgi:hypothetical protein
VRTCLLCDNPLTGPEVYRIRIGGVSYEESDAPQDLMMVQFVQEPGRDYFQDGSTAKWVCHSCAVDRGILTKELDYGSCQIDHGGDFCGLAFEEWSEPGSDCVLEVERGVLHHNASDRGPPIVFITQDGGCVHFNCACDDPWRLPLCELSSDSP